MSSDDDDVGYKKPPKHSRFRKGRSGNPRGRPKGTRTFKKDVLEVLNTPVRVTKGGVEKNVPIQKAVLLRFIEKALKGDTRAMERVIALAQNCTDGNRELPELDLTLLTDEQLEILSKAARLLKSLVPAGARGGGDPTR